MILGDRDAGDTSDVFRCLNAADGTERWTIRYPAPARLDYGNAPRATPLVHGDKVYLYGALGHLTCAELETGKILWKKQLRAEFKAKEDIPWGVASSPLIVDDKLIVNPGGPEASLVALHPQTGEVLWKTPGDESAFSSFILGIFGGKRQLVGYDKNSLGGWDPATGRRLWKLVPPKKNEFNVPTAIDLGGRLLVSTENNGTRIYRFKNDGTIIPEPEAQSAQLAPDSHTPVVVGGRVFGVWEELFCLDLAGGLKTLWSSDDSQFYNYATAMGGPNRVLIISAEGELILLDPTANAFEPISRLRLFKDDSGVLAHPALVGHRLYVRNSSAVYCVDLDK